MLKGKTRFELTDVNTGERKVFEKHNMVTNTLSNLFNGLNSHLYHPLETTTHLWSIVNNLMPIYDKAFGGLLLFDGLLDESQNTVYQNGNVHIVGSAYNAYSGTSVWRGSRNNNESGLLYDGTKAIGYRFVWDFGTDKANGNIQAAALTSSAGGSGGCMNIDMATESEADASMASVMGSSFTVFQSAITSSSHRILRISGNDIFYSNGSNLYKTSVFYPSEVKIIDSYKAFSTAELIKTFGYSLNNANIMPNGNIAVTFAETGKFTTHIISVSDWTETTVETPFDDASTYTSTAFYYDSAKLYLVNANGVKILDATTGDLLHNSTTFKLSSPSSSYVVCVGDYLLFANVINRYESTTYKRGIAISRITNAISNVNAPFHKNTSTSYYYYHRYRQISCDDVLSPYILFDDYYHSSSDYFYVTAVRMSPYILTVQNLGSPGVTKTNAQTMKVTYEITEDLEPENI